MEKDFQKRLDDLKFSSDLQNELVDASLIEFCINIKEILHRHDNRFGHCVSPSLNKFLPKALSDFKKCWRLEMVQAENLDLWSRAMRRHKEGMTTENELENLYRKGSR